MTPMPTKTSLTNSTASTCDICLEAMMNGKPVIASDLPGVRQPVKITGMGRVSPVGDSAALAKNIMAVLRRPENYRGESDTLREQFSPDASAEKHATLFENIAGGLGKL